jgi:hypothetical protein
MSHPGKYLEMVCSFVLDKNVFHTATQRCWEGVIDFFDDENEMIS